MNRLITLMTDFGLRDGYTAIMKGVIKKIHAGAECIDVSHLISPQNITEAAIVFGRGRGYYPDGTIHVCVVDPGVGTARRPLAAVFGSQTYIGPDNGLITLMHIRTQAAGEPLEFYHLDQDRYWLPIVSHCFHGRDIFAPVAAYLAAGLAALADMGTRIDDPVLLPLPQVKKTATGLQGAVIHIDHFGNLATNIRDADLAGLGEVGVEIGGCKIEGLVRTFGERAPGELVALVNSFGELSVAVVNGHAGERLGVQVGAPVTVTRILQKGSI